MIEHDKSHVPQAGTGLEVCLMHAASEFGFIVGLRALLMLLSKSTAQKTLQPLRVSSASIEFHPMLFYLTHQRVFGHDESRQIPYGRNVGLDGYAIEGSQRSWFMYRGARSSQYERPLSKNAQARTRLK